MFFALPQTPGSGTPGTTETRGHWTGAKSETSYRFKKRPKFRAAWQPPYASTAVQQFNCRFRHTFPGFLSARKGGGNRFSWADEKAYSQVLPGSAWAARGVAPLQQPKRKQLAESSMDSPIEKAEGASNLNQYAGLDCASFDVEAVRSE